MKSGLRILVLTLSALALFAVSALAGVLMSSATPGSLGWPALTQRNIAFLAFGSGICLPALLVGLAGKRGRGQIRR